MSERTVIVTGAGGFIGGSLVRHFRSLGWAVRALVRTVPEQRAGGAEYLPYDLAGPAPEGAFRGADTLVHCAYVSRGASRDSDRINVEGTRALLALCRKCGVRPVFLSSFSAQEGARSRYGRMKLEIERMFDPARDLVLRPALVVGPGGLFGSMSRFIARRRIIPLPGSGCQPLQVIAVDDLCRVIERGVRDGTCGVYRIAHPEPVTLRAICGVLAARHGRRAILVPVPLGLVLLSCRLAESLGIRLPVSSDSVLGLGSAKAVDTAGDLAVFGVSPKAPADCLGALAPPRAAGAGGATPA